MTKKTEKNNKIRQSDEKKQYTHKIILKDQKSPLRELNFANLGNFAVYGDTHDLNDDEIEFLKQKYEKSDDFDQKIEKLQEQIFNPYKFPKIRKVKRGNKNQNGISKRYGTFL